MSKAFKPKLAGARPRLTAALNSPDLTQFTPRMLDAVKSAAKVVANKNPPKSKLSATLKALMGNF